MNQELRFTVYALPALLAAALAPSAHAGCGDLSNLQAPFVFAQPSSSAQAVSQRASFAAAAIAGGNAMVNTASIVGTWKGQTFSRQNGNHRIGRSKAPYRELVHGHVGAKWIFHV
jgi:hypothetical protein